MYIYSIYIVYIYSTYIYIVYVYIYTIYIIRVRQSHLFIDGTPQVSILTSTVMVRFDTFCILCISCGIKWWKK